MARATALVLMLGVGACSPPSPSPSPSPSPTTEWDEPPAYSFTLDSRCGERDLIGRFRVEVEDGSVVSVEGLDDRGRAAAEVIQPDDVPTLADLLAVAEEAEDDGADEVDLTTDPVDGHPVSIDIDWDADAVDDEECYTISDYAPAS